MGQGRRKGVAFLCTCTFQKDDSKREMSVTLKVFEIGLSVTSVSKEFTILIVDISLNLGSSDFQGDGFYLPVSGSRGQGQVRPGRVPQGEAPCPLRVRGRDLLLLQPPAG